MFKGNALAEIDEILSKTPSIIDYHIMRKPVSTTSYQMQAKEKMHVIIWVNKDLKESEDVMNVLSDEKVIEKQIIDLAKSINISVSFDIYEK